MSHLSNLSWFAHMDKYDEPTKALLFALSEPGFTSRSFNAMYRIGEAHGMRPWTVDTVITALVREGVVSMTADKNGKLQISIVEKLAKKLSTIVVVSDGERVTGTWVGPFREELTSTPLTTFLKKEVGLDEAKIAEFYASNGYLALEHGYIHATNMQVPIV